jgi:hypothetical protein
MDFLNPTKKRAQKIQLIVGYVLIAIAIGLVTAILVFQSYGYDLDRKTGAIIQNGLLVVAAQPQPANIYLNGKQYKSQNDAKLVLPSDVYKIELKRDGYRDWSRTISLAGGSIERLVYPFLFPTNLTSKSQKTYTGAPALATQSPDRHWLLIQQPDQVGVFDQFDANDSKKAPTTVTIPSGLLASAAEHKLTEVEWSTDNRHVLLRDDYTGGREFIMLDRETPASSYNVNTTLKTNPTEVAMRDKHFDQLYLYDQTARKLELGDTRDNTMKPVLTGVLAFKSHGSDRILYATAEGATAGKTRIMVKDGDGSFFLREVVAGPTYLLDLAQYSNHWYMAAGTAADGRVYVYKDPLDKIKTPVASDPAVVETVLRVNNPTWIGFSATAQSLAVQGGSLFSVYDAENMRSYKYDLNLPLDSPKASWMDGDRLMVNSGGKMVVVDYDGLNMQTLTANQPGLTPFFDRQFKLLYNIAPATTPAGSYSLNRLNLIVGANN